MHPNNRFYLFNSITPNLAEKPSLATASSLFTDVHPASRRCLLSIQKLAESLARSRNPLEFPPFSLKPQETNPNNRFYLFNSISSSAYNAVLQQKSPPPTTPGQSRANVPIQAKHPSSFGHLSARHKTTQTGGDADLIFTNIFIVIVIFVT